jgi:porin
MMKRTTFVSMLLSAIILLVALAIGSDAMAEEAAKKTSEEIAKLSLIEQAPIIVNINRRYYKFYGDPNTKKGDILERNYLTGNWVGGGLRDKLVDSGIYFDVAMTQFYGGNVYGGTQTNDNYTGSLDLMTNLDTAKLSNGVWPGATVFLHGEVAWGRDIGNTGGLDQSVGALIPTNYDTTMPTATDTGQFDLSEYYIVQSLSPEVSLWVGQMNGAGLIDGNQFANDEKHQFMNTVMVDNPIVGPFAPYTAFTVAAVWLPTTEHVFIAAVMDNDGKVSQTVASTYNPDETVFVGSYGWLPEFDGKPGRYQIVGAYSNKDTPSYAIGNRLRLGEELVGIVPIKEKTDNYVTIITADQYVYVKDKARQIGWGPFFRFGWAPKNRNAIDQFYSLGIGGRGLLIPGRDLDFWGIGWGGTHLSSDLRSDLQDLGFKKPRSFEHAIEAFYNIELTGWAHLTFDTQFIINPIGARVVSTTSSVKDQNFAFVLGSRLQIDF